ncbi:hypothetical protein NDU88_003157 [Pleurodeles waltl]|uniref:Uncharacterized protein n=1 Tax=Pleurodeles waltl TaxID=8319 RepID=A0AAV7MTS3_PLEWA|nr:hypothetical protein NDU88_003157 [Pleurodeles waltl]
MTTLMLSLIPRRGLRATPLRVRRNSSAARHHNAAPAAFHLSSGFEFCGVHIRASTAAQQAEPSPRYTQEPEAVLARCYHGAARHGLPHHFTSSFLL